MSDLVQYDQEAEALERKLEAAAPLLYWHVARVEDYQVDGQKFDADTFNVGALMRVNGKGLTGKTQISAELLSTANFDAAEYIATNMATGMAYEIVAWRPEQPAEGSAE